MKHEHPLAFTHFYCFPVRFDLVFDSQQRSHHDFSVPSVLLNQQFNMEPTEPVYVSSSVATRTEHPYVALATHPARGGGDMFEIG